MTVNTLRPEPAPNREFSVEGAHRYDTRGPWRWIASHLGRYPLLLLGFLACVTLTTVLFSAVPRLTGVAFDEVLRSDPSVRRLFGLAALILGAVVLRGLSDLGQGFSVEVIAQRLERDARDELYLSLLGKSQTFHNRQRVGDIMARAANDVRQLNPMMSPGAALITESALGIVVPLVFVAFLDWRLLAAPLAFVLVFVVALRHYMRQLTPVSGALRREFGRMNAGLNETITGIEVVKSTVQEAQEGRKFLGNARAYRDSFVRQGEVQARYLPLLLLGVALTAAFAHGLFLLSRGQISVGDLVAYMGLVGALRGPAFLSIFSFSLVQLGVAGSERILELIEARTEFDENRSGHTAAIVGDLRFDGVDFRYESTPAAGAVDAPPAGTPETRLTLDGVDFHAPPGTTVAIVGQTGSGKSTLTKLVNRAYDPTAGRVLVDGVDVRDWNLDSLRSQISVIEQDVFLFSRSVHDNIAFGAGPGVGREAVVEAAKAAQAHEFILGFSDGYDTVIGERGVTLSGGQRQRLAIARALLTDPRILVLDDSTSAIDSATEDLIQRAINRVLEGRTTLMITHRLSQIRRADLILVLQGGRIVDQGDHDALMARSSLYRRIFAHYD